MRIIRYILLGIGTFLIFPPFLFTPIGFILFPLICFELDLINKLPKKNYFFFGFTFSFGFLSLYLSWIVNPFLVFEETKNLAFLSIFLILFISIIFGVIFYISKILFRDLLPSFVLLPYVFIVFELIISNILTGFPWISFSLIISNLSIGLTLIKYTGTIFTSFLVVLFFSLPYLFLITQNKTKNIFPILLAPIILFTMFFCYSYFNKEIGPIKNFKIKIIQLNKEINILKKNKLKIVEDKILRAINSSDANLIIFAENNYPYLIEKLKFPKIQSIINHNQTVIIGGTRIDNETKSYYNSLFAINNIKIKKFDKKILVPFGEFLPMRNFFSFIEQISGPQDFSNGLDNRLIKIGEELSFIPVICYEIIFYWKLINKINYDADILINITNDKWFGSLLGPYQHLYLTKLRASEFNKPIIRVSNNGVSAIIDNKSNILAYSKLNNYEEIEHSFTYRKNNSLFVFHKFFLFSLIFLFLITIYFSKNKTDE